MSEPSGTVQQIKGVLWIAAAIVMGGVLAMGIPRLVSLLPWSVEKAAARLLVTPPFNVCQEENNLLAAAHLKTVIQRLYPIRKADDSFPLQIEILRRPEVNAYATLAGRVYVFDGLLKEVHSPEELAGILAHEIEHVRRRHIFQGVVVRLLTVEGLKYVFSGGGSLGPEVMRIALNLEFGREQERETDDGGLRRLQDAQIDVAGYEEFFKRLNKNGASIPAFLSDHPAHAERAEAVKRYSGGKTRSILNAREWAELKNYCR